ncbi:MAG: tail fiber domain-containing protein, partial [Aeromonas veronii]
YTAQRGQDLEAMRTGQGLVTGGNQGLVGQGQQLYDNGGMEMNAPWAQLGATTTGQNTAPNQQYYQNRTNMLGNIMGSMLSDRRLKDNIKRVGALDDGTPLYSYTYKWGGPAQIGVMAQELEKTRPDLVGTHASGFKMVNYGGL